MDLETLGACVSIISLLQDVLNCFYLQLSLVLEMLVAELLPHGAKIALSKTFVISAHKRSE